MPGQGTYPVRCLQWLRASKKFFAPDFLQSKNGSGISKQGEQSTFTKGCSQIPLLSCSLDSISKTCCFPLWIQKTECLSVRLTGLQPRALQGPSCLSLAALPGDEDPWNWVFRLQEVRMTLKRYSQTLSFHFFQARGLRL